MDQARGTLQITVGPPTESAVCQVLAQHEGKQFYWVFLGESIDGLNSLRRSLHNRGKQLEIGKKFHEIAKSLRQPYIDYIGRLSQKNSSIWWWAGPVAEKNPFRSRAFPHLAYLKLFNALLESDIESHGCNTFVFFVEHRALRQCIVQNASSLGNVTVKRIEPIELTISETARNILNPILRRILFLVGHTSRILLTKYLYGLNNAGEYKGQTDIVLIISWVDRTSFYNQSGRYREQLFGELTSWVKEKGKKVVIVPHIPFKIDSYRQTIKKLIASEESFFIPHAFLKVTDILRLVLKTIIPPAKRNYPLFDGMDVSVIINDDNMQSYIRNDIASDLLFYELIRHLKENDVNIERLIYPYENHSWEKIVCLAVREFYPQVRLVAHQHANISSMLLNYFFSKEESRVLPFPDIVITNGKYSDRLFRNSGYDPDKVILGGSVRYTGVLSALDEGDKVTSPKENNSRCPTILVTPSLEWAEAAEFIWKVIGAFGTLDQYRVILKCHPDLPYNRIARELKISTLPGHFTVVDRPVGELLLESDVLLYTSSTTCIEALARGVPVVQVNSSLTIDMDPLRGYPGVRRSVSTQEEIVEAVKEILTTNRAEQIKGKTVWKDTVKDLFVPVYENIFHLFLN